MFTWRFWREALERAVKTAAQFVIGAWGIGDGIFNALEMDWSLAAGAALGGAVLSILTSLASLSIGAEDSPSGIQ
jgi:hypothetical protein